MKWGEYKELLKDEWEFHKKHPEMFTVWVIYILAAYIIIKEGTK